MGNTIPIKVFAKYAFQKYIFLQDAPSEGYYENVIFVNNYTNL